MADTLITRQSLGDFREFDVGCTFRQFTRIEELAELSLSSKTRDVSMSRAFHFALNECIE